MDYNTQREKLILPEYGRYVQEMVKKVKTIEDKQERTRQIKAVVNVMGTLNPQLREMNDYYHKLWDHVHLIANLDLDVDAPFPAPEKATFDAKPHTIDMQRNPVKVMHYGRNIQNMVMAIAAKPEGEERNSTTIALALYMRKQYLIWNKDTVSDQTIFRDIEMLSGGALIVPEGTKLTEIQGEYRQPNSTMPRRPQGKWNKNKKKKR